MRTACTPREPGIPTDLGGRGPSSRVDQPAQETATGTAAQSSPATPVTDNAELVVNHSEAPLPDFGEPSAERAAGSDFAPGLERPIRILLLDDSELDIDLMVREMGKAGVRFTCFRAACEEEMLAALDSVAPDVAVVDYCIPGYDGLAAIAAIHKKRPDLPVIVVSGRMGEETAVDTIKSGAFDYVLKSNIKRLPPSVLRAARKADERRILEQTQRALRESQEQFRSLVELSPDAIYLVSDDCFVFSNPAGLRLMGAKTASEVATRRLDDHLIEGIRLALGSKSTQEQSHGGFVPTATTVIVRLDGTCVPVEITAAPINLHGQPAVQLVARDISERLRAEQALRRAFDELEERVKERTRDLLLSHTKLEQEVGERQRAEIELRANRAFIDAVFTSLPGHMAVLDEKGTIIAVNESWQRAAAEKNGTPQSTGVGVNYLTVCQHAAQAGDAAAAAALAGIESVLRGQQSEFSFEYSGDQNGEVLWASLLVNALKRPEGGAVVTHVDITKRRQAELEVQRLHQDLYRFGRVSVMGELAAAIAHELRQPLTALRANTEAAMDLLGPGAIDVAELRDILGEMITEINRAAEVISRMRSLLSKGTTSRQDLDVNALVNEVLPLIRERAVMQGVTIRLDTADGLPQVRADRIQLQQVLINLMINSLDAMQETPAGERSLVVRTASPLPGEVQIAVCDSGNGLPAGKNDSIFESFYSTKPDGMGMGLSICRSIVQAHDGRIWADNNPDRGATFFIMLPAKNGKK